jgi:hypothetical protein
MANIINLEEHQTGRNAAFGGEKQIAVCHAVAVISIPERKRIETFPDCWRSRSSLASMTLCLPDLRRDQSFLRSGLRSG